MIRTLLLMLLPCVAQAEPFRVATFNTELSRDGPGLLLRDIQRRDQQVLSVVAVITNTAPDILVLQGIDWDHNGRALAALADLLFENDVHYPFQFAQRPNNGWETDLDLDGDGVLNGPGDAQGWGQFSGHGGIAVLSRYPIDVTATQDFSDILWRDLPGATLPQMHGSPFPSAEAQSMQRLSSTAHWSLPIATPSGRLNLMTFHATPPVFDGPEDRNGLRNRDEIRFWQAHLSGSIGQPPDGWFVIAGDANLDPWDSDGHVEAIRALLADPRLQDPTPQSTGAARAGPQEHQSPDAMDTVDWTGVGRLRVDYVLPSSDWRVVNAGVYWPPPGADGHGAAISASRHRLVWVDLERD